MKKTHSVPYRFRLLFNVLALMLALVALHFSPTASADRPGGRECSGGCISWDAINGCTVYQVCCVDTDTGGYQCWRM
ncbi:MAG: hypothetical protein QOD00_191 [Blastocatellia bacterium]|jgi:hypothetical protein|nr:hypothetical protein [Blastocatellia bacterium]